MKTIDGQMEEPSGRNWRSFGALTGLVGLNAFHDNFARFTLIPLSTWLLGEGTSLPHLLSFLLLLPFILFAPTSGWLADRFSKTAVVRWSVWLQVAVLGVMAAGAYFQSLWGVVGAFFLLALQSALLSPAKQGILKELLGRKRLALGSGITEGVVILMILGGQIASGLVFDARLRETGNGWEAAFGPIGFLMVGCVLALVLGQFVERVEARGAERLSARRAFGHFADLKTVMRERPMRLSVWGVAFFWGFAGFVNLAVIQVAAEMNAGGVGTGSANSLMMGAASVGIAVGSLLAGWWSRKGTELGLIPFG
ncbi:MAG: MFS transporter, partial [Verrucomicrobiota bacterium]